MKHTVQWGERTKDIEHLLFVTSMDWKTSPLLKVSGFLACFYCPSLSLLSFSWQNSAALPKSPLASLNSKAHGVRPAFTQRVSWESGKLRGWTWTLELKMYQSNFIFAGITVILQAVSTLGASFSLSHIGCTTHRKQSLNVRLYEHLFSLA